MRIGDRLVGFLWVRRVRGQDDKHFGKLTALFVARTKRPGMYSDGGNLYLQVESESARSWVFRAWTHKTFEYGTWGGEFRAEFAPMPGEIVVQEHWCSSGFANTDLDLQLKKHGIHQLIIIGLIAHTCIEATVRFAAEVGYEVTVVKDATADYSDEMMHAALDINMPNYASAIVATREVVDAISSL
jgi:nicotinamidase-related amidase